MMKQIRIGNDGEKNLKYDFEAECAVENGASLAVASNCPFRLTIDDRFVFYGPIRSAYKKANISELSLEEFAGKTVKIKAELLYYGIPNFYIELQKGFFACEVKNKDGLTLLDTDGFSVYRDFSKMQQVRRYSYQRGFTEAYDCFQKKEKIKAREEFVCDLEKTDVSLPLLYEKEAIAVEGGKLFSGRNAFSDYSRNRRTGEFIDDGNEISFNVSDYADRIGYEKSDFNDVLENGFATFDLKKNLSGFLSLEIEAFEPSEILVLFDETAECRNANYLKGGALDIDPYRLMAVNEMFFRVPKGNRKLISMEATTMRFIRIAVPSGKVKIRSVRLIAYENRDVTLCFRCSDNELNEIFEAAKATFCQNAVDVLTDCPSRERAGWLCDSYFSGEAERALTGANKIETNFLYCLLHRKSRIISRNVFPMCYPSDHSDGKFIPNWGMWLVLEVENYKNAGGRIDIVNGLTEQAEEFAEYLRSFRNADGLLENLESWVFVEMSEANKLTNGVNFPTNMLYAAMLESLSRLTKNGKYAIQAEQTRAAVQTYGKSGKYFVDHAETSGGKYVPCTEKISEVCQYYAFYFGFASKEKNGELFCACIERTDSKLLKANDFFGRYLRIGYLVHVGEYRRALSDIKAYFYKEAEKTGTLWEGKDGKTSLCHGFTSVLTAWIAKASKAIDDTAKIYYIKAGR